MANLKCYYAEDRQFRSFFGWLNAGVLNRGQIYPLRVNFTYSGGKFNDAEVIILVFSTALVSKQKTGGKFYVRNLERGKWEKKG